MEHAQKRNRGCCLATEKKKAEVEEDGSPTVARMVLAVGRKGSWSWVGEDFSGQVKSRVGLQSGIDVLEEMDCKIYESLVSNSTTLQDSFISLYCGSDEVSNVADLDANLDDDYIYKILD